MHYGDILQYWFGEITNELSDTSKMQLWYASSSEVDADIKARFEPVLLAASRGQCDDWLNDIEGRVAMIILYDQFTRNIYRGKAEAFAYDTKGLKLALSLLDEPAFSSLPLIQKIFCLHPLEHAESIEMQERCVSEMRRLADDYQTKEYDIQHKECIDSAISYAELHRDIIAQFGRFPHRNAVLKREDTTEETAYLNDGAHRFGQ